MIKIDSIGCRAIFSLMLIVGLLYMPVPAFSQDEAKTQNLIVNGGFEEGFQDFGVGFGWGAFSNGNALVGWNVDTWDQVVAAGQNAQLIEIRESTEMNRYAGIYQTVPVVPGEQYKLTVRGLIRSTEGDIVRSNYGYRLQYGLDYEGNTAWELIDNDAWVEIPWDEQPLDDVPGGSYRFDTFETTITAQSDQLTLFLRGWKKWIDGGTGIFDLDEISLVGPAPEDFEAPVAQTAAVGQDDLLANTETVAPEPAAPVSDEAGDLPSEEPPAEISAPEISAQPDQSSQSQLPVSGQGRDNSILYILVSGGLLLLVLLIGAVTATMGQRHPVE